jgi:L-ascorbate metabolism protein UlaG (beta-lactamase superfamily)
MKIDNLNRLFPIRKKDQYFNSHHDHVESLFFQTIPSFLLSLYGRKKRQPENKLDWVAQDTPLVMSHDPLVTWIGHATFLIQVGGLNVLTDPIFGNASPFFPRLLPPGIALAQLPPIDIVLISHNHRDHCDLRSLHALQKSHPHMHLMVAAGDKKWLLKKGFKQVDEFEWWQTHTRGAVEFTFLPAHHWSAQGVFDRNRSLWGSWMISSPIHVEESAKSSSRNTIYFAGDTSYSDHFNHIAKEHPHIDVALMPIAPEFPHPSMRKSHMDSHQAVQAFVDLKAATFVPMHWGTFAFGTDTFLGPIERLQRAWRMQELLAHKNLIIPKVGQRITLV